MDLIRIIFAILLPPLGVFLQVGLGVQFWLNILLTLLGGLPGMDPRALAYCDRQALTIA